MTPWASVAFLFLTATRPTPLKPLSITVAEHTVTLQRDVRVGVANLRDRADLAVERNRVQ